MAAPPAASCCPRCSATTRAGAPWCTQCYLDLRAPDPAPAPAPAPALPGGTGWPCGACGAANDLSVGACAGCGAPFLAAVRDAEPPLLTLPLVGDLGRLTRAQRVGLAAATVLVAMLLPALLALLQVGGGR